jgi:hypothetical protein
MYHWKPFLPPCTPPCAVASWPTRYTRSKPTHLVSCTCPTSPLPLPPHSFDYEQGPRAQAARVSLRPGYHGGKGLIEPERKAENSASRSTVPVRRRKPQQVPQKHIQGRCDISLQKIHRSTHALIRRRGKKECWEGGARNHARFYVNGATRFAFV